MYSLILGSIARAFRILLYATMLQRSQGVRWLPVTSDLLFPEWRHSFRSTSQAKTLFHQTLQTLSQFLQRTLLRISLCMLRDNLPRRKSLISAFASLTLLPHQFSEEFGTLLRSQRRIFWNAPWVVLTDTWYGKNNWLIHLLIGSSDHWEANNDSMNKWTDDSI